MVCQRSITKNRQQLYRQVLSDLWDITHLAWETPVHLRCPELLTLPFLEAWLTASCSIPSGRTASSLPGRQKARTQELCFLCHLLIMTHLAPSRETYLPCSLSSCNWRSSFPCLSLLHRTQLFGVLQSLWLLQVGLRMTLSPHPLFLSFPFLLFSCVIKPSIYAGLSNLLWVFKTFFSSLCVCFCFLFLF